MEKYNEWMKSIKFLIDKENALYIPFKIQKKQPLYPSSFVYHWWEA